MNNLTKVLLSGSALAALASVPAVAKPAHPAFHVTALHGGKAVNKTQLHDSKIKHVTYTFGVYSSASASSMSQDIYGTYYKWNSTRSGYFTLCSKPKQKLKTPRRTVYGSTKADTETYSFGCASGPTVFHGDAWTNKTGEPGNVDTWRSVLLGRFMAGGARTRYKGTLNLDVNLSIF